jgi:nucleotide-binding universal stress UspA family protein
MALTTIVAGCDLSAPSDAALDRAAALAEAHHARLVLVHALADDAPAGQPDNVLAAKLGEVSAAVRAAEAVRLADKLTALQQRGIAAELASPVGPPGEVLAQIAGERDAELVVVGTHGHTGLARFLLGSVATATLRHAPCDVLVCRGPGNGGFARPLVATDFSAAAARAIGHVAELLGPRDKPAIDLVHAWQLPAGSWGATLLGQARFPWSTVRDAVLASAKGQLDRLIASQVKLGVELRGELIQGPPASVVTAAAERGAHDLIAVGTHGHRGFRRLLLGSVAEDVIRHAPCSVLVVHGEHAGETARFHKQ